MGRVRRHCELLRPGEYCLGGGFYELDYVSHRLLLSGASSEYGEPKWEKVERITTSAFYQGLEIVYRSWNSWEDAVAVSDFLEVVYI